MTRFSKVTTIATSLLIGTMSAGIAHADFVTTYAGFSDSKKIDFSQFANCTSTFMAGCSGTTSIDVGGLIGETVLFLSPQGGLYNAIFGVGDNGWWDSGRNGFAGMSSGGGGSISFTFSTGVSDVGAFLNYYGDPFWNDVIPMLSIYDQADNLLEMVLVADIAPISTPGQSNAGAFRGFSRAANDIYRIEMRNNLWVVDDLTFARTSNPGTLGIQIVGDGTVASADGLISCPSSSCSATYSANGKVKLYAEPATGAEFVGWDYPGCEDAITRCSVRINRESTLVVRATFRNRQVTEINVSEPEQTGKKLSLSEARAANILQEVLNDERILLRPPHYENRFSDSCYYGAISAGVPTAAGGTVLYALNDLAVDITAKSLGAITTGSDYGDFLLRFGVNVGAAYFKEEDINLEIVNSIISQSAGYLLPGAVRKYVGDMPSIEQGLLLVSANSGKELLKLSTGTLKKEAVISGYLSGNNLISDDLSLGAPATTVSITWYYNPLTRTFLAYIAADCSEQGKSYYMVRYQIEGGTFGRWSRFPVENSEVFIKLD